MKIPSSVKISGHLVQIFHKEKIVIGETPCGGLADFGGNTITVAHKDNDGRDLALTNIEEAFLHELLHQISDKYGIDLIEHKIRTLAAGLYQVLHDNKLRF